MKANINLKDILTSVCLCCVITVLGACAKSTHQSQPPVVINVNSGAAHASNDTSKKKINQRATPPIVKKVDSSMFSAPIGLGQQFTQEQAPCETSSQQLEPITLDEASFLNMQIHEIALQLLRNFRDEAGPGGPVAVATFVDLNNLYRTSPFGRYIAEQLMGELQRAGFNVVEIRKADSIMVKPRYGEYGLSREIQELAKQSSARYVLTGTYVNKGRYVLINARLISNENNLVASSGLKILRKDPFLERMLWPSSSPETVPTVRVPVKELGSLSEMKILSGS